MGACHRKLENFWADTAPAGCISSGLRHGARVSRLPTAEPPFDARVFLGWHRPLRVAVADHLTRQWREGPLDLSDTLVIVPTQNAGRQVRAALAVLAEEREAGVLAPETLTPESFAAACLPPGKPLANEAEVMAAWMAVLTTTPLEEMDAIFPVPPPVRDAAWALTVAETLQSTRATLAESGWSLAQVAQTAAVAEPQRWQQLAVLEAAYEAELARCGRSDLTSAQLATQGTSLVWPWPEIKRVVLAAVPDPLPLALELLLRHMQEATECRLEILVWAPPEDAAAFDGWGRPRREVWKQREIELPPPAQVHALANPAAQAKQAASFLAWHEVPAVTLLPGLVDPNLAAPLERVFTQAGQPIFFPEGTPASTHPFTKLLNAWAALLRSPDWSTFVQFLRLPLVAAAVGRSVWADQLLKIVDDFYARHLPARLEDVPLLAALDRPDTSAEKAAPSTAQAAAGEESPPETPEQIRARQATQLERAAQAVLHQLQVFRRALLPDALAAWLTWITQGREYSSDLERDAGWIRLATRAAELAAQIQTAWPQGSRVEQLHLLCRLLNREQLPTHRTPAAVEVVGWLELPWLEAPHLVLLGCNDAYLPAAPLPDPFLPDSLREALGLRCHACREARDAYWLTALLRSRDGEGRVDILFGRVGDGDEALRPSRLLFRCSDEALPARVRQLLAPPPVEPRPPARVAWKLRAVVTAEQATPKHLNVTSFSDYLACPFRFFLKHILKMRPVEPQRRELDARGFGTLCHQAFEFFAQDESLRLSTDEQKIRACLLAGLDRAVGQQFGTPLPLSLLLQVEAARQRLSAAAAVQAQAVRDGWVIAEVETKLSTLRGAPFLVGGVEIRGQVDRLEINHALGAWRVVDYKTSAKAKSPRQHHLARVRAEALPPEWCLVFPSGEGQASWRWVNLQLPLYGAALADTMKERYGLNGAAAFQAAYFNLPQDLGSVGIEVWQGMDEALLQSAMTCAEGVIASILNHEFWPPATAVTLDDLKDLWLGSPEETYDPPVILKDADPEDTAAGKVEEEEE